MILSSLLFVPLLGCADFVQEIISRHAFFPVCNYAMEIWDRIKGLKLRRLTDAYYGASAVHEILFYYWCTVARVLWLVYCGEATFKFIAAAVFEPQYTRDKKVSCVYSCSCTVALVLRLQQLAVIGNI